MRSVIASSRVAVKNPDDYEARSNLMWSSTWALNTLIGCGKSEDWMVHMIGHAIGAYTDATHGMALAGVSAAYYRHIMEDGLVASPVLQLPYGASPRRGRPTGSSPRRESTRSPPG